MKDKLKNGFWRKKSDVDFSVWKRINRRSFEEKNQEIWKIDRGIVQLKCYRCGIIT